MALVKRRTSDELRRLKRRNAAVRRHRKDWVRIQFEVTKDERRRIKRVLQKGETFTRVGRDLVMGWLESREKP